MWPKAERGSRSLDIRNTPTDRFDRRRSVELARSTRRYDEGWGAAERADTRLKCSDGIIHHVHSQVLSLWSTVLRNMIVLIPGPQLLESTHGLAYVLNVDEGSSVWGAVLDVMYPVLRPAHPPGHPADPVLQRTHEWVLLEQCLLLADKYDMPVVTQTLLQQTLFSAGAAAYSLDPSQPSYALHWLALADKLQLPQLVQSALACVQASLAQLAAQPGAMDALLAYAHEHLSKQQVVQLLQASMQHAASHHHQQQQQQTHLQQQQEPVQMMLVVPSSPSPSPSWPYQQHQPHLNSHPHMSQGGSMGPPGGPWSSAANQAFMAAAAAAASAAAAAAFNTCSSRGHAACGGSGSASSAPGLESVQECSSSSDDDSRAEEQQQRVDMCRVSALFAPAAAVAAGSVQQQQQQAQQQQQEACAGLGSGWGNAPGAGQAGTVCAALPVTQPPPQQQQQQQQQQCASMNPPRFGFGVNAGNTSIEDWMKQSFPMQADSMCG